MRLAGLVAIYQRPNTSKPAPAHTIYPYLLFLPLTCAVVATPSSRQCADEMPQRHIRAIEIPPSNACQDFSALQRMAVRPIRVTKRGEGGP